MHDLQANYDKILKLTKQHFLEKTDRGNFQFYPRKPKMSDLELISLTICAEASSIDSEHLLFSKLKNDYPKWYSQIGSLTRYNRRKRRLSSRIWEVGQFFGNSLITKDDDLIVDSMPCPVVKNSREKSFSICREDWLTRPMKGYSAVDKRYFIGYKIHVLISTSGCVCDAQITQANIHDIHFLKNWKSRKNLKNKELLGDKGYISNQVQTNLFDSHKIKLQTPSRSNQLIPTEWNKIKRRRRKRIETLFSQLCDQFRIKLNFAKTFNGFTARIFSKLAAVAALQLVNHQNNRPLNHLKHAWSG